MPTPMMVNSVGKLIFSKINSSFWGSVFPLGCEKGPDKSGKACHLVGWLEQCSVCLYTELVK